MVNRKTIYNLFLIVFIAIPILFLFPILVHSATFTVDSVADAVDANPGDGVCDDGSGNCALRAAIMETNALPGADVIELPGGTYTLTIAGQDEDASETGDLDINDDLTINGAGNAITTIDANEIDRVLHIIGANIEISDVTVIGGKLSSGRGGGIFNDGTANLTNCTIRNNSSAGTGGIDNRGITTLNNCTIRDNDGGDGAGGIENFGTATLTDCTISGNVSSGFGDAGGLLNLDIANLTNCTISNNDGGEGFGGIENAPSAIATLTSCTISGNNAQLEGGGILNNGTVTMTDCTISNNKSDASGGGILNNGTVTMTNCKISNNESGECDECGGGGILNSGTATMTNCTISSNVVLYSAKSAIDNGGLLAMTNCTISNNEGVNPSSGIENNGPATLTNCTISNNEVGDDGGGIRNFAPLELKNSIVANNISGRDCAGGVAITSLDHNLDSDGTCNLTQPNDLPNTDPSLGPLADNGGPTLTHALLAGSPAIDAGDDLACPETDQRGIARPQDGDGDGEAICDIGAYEFVPLYIEVEIDIKPGSYPNSINLKSKGKMPVAILTTDDFDAQHVDPVSCQFAGAYPLRWNMEDVDNDSDDDMLFHFKTRELDLTRDSTEATLEGETYDGIKIIGTDSVKIVPKFKWRGKENKWHGRKDKKHDKKFKKGK